MLSGLFWRGVECWFASGMDRASSWCRGRLLGIGLVFFLCVLGVVYRRLELGSFVCIVIGQIRLFFLLFVRSLFWLFGRNINFQKGLCFMSRLLFGLCLNRLGILHFCLLCFFLLIFRWMNLQSYFNLMIRCNFLFLTLLIIFNLIAWQITFWYLNFKFEILYLLNHIIFGLLRERL